MAVNIPQGTFLDAGETIFFARELETILQENYDILYAELKATRVIPVSFADGPGAETITWRSFDKVGQAKIIANYADDLPRADVKGKEESAIVKTIGDSYGYNFQEIQAAMMASRPLESMKAEAARRAIDQKINDIAFQGDSMANLPGFLTNASVPAASAPADGTASARNFEAKTPDQIIRDMNNLINGVMTTTKGVEMVRRVLLPTTTYAYLASTPRASVAETTILEFLRRVHPGVEFDWLNELETAGTSSTKRVVAYNPSPTKVSLRIPRAFTQLPPQARNLEFVVPCLARIGGTIWFYPLSGSFLDQV